jgi:hypothetical protein
VAGYSGEHKPVSSEEIQPALKRIWQIYSEFYTWIDPEDPEDEEEDEEE